MALAESHTAAREVKEVAKAGLDPRNIRKLEGFVLTGAPGDGVGPGARLNSNGGGFTDLRVGGVVVDLTTYPCARLPSAFQLFDPRSFSAPFESFFLPAST